MDPMGHWHGFWMGGMWIFPLLMMLIMIVVVFVCARAFLGGDFRSPCSRHNDGVQQHRSESALEIAKRRYAQGEITKEEFAEIKKAIE